MKWIGRKDIFSWALYHWAANAFSLIIVSTLLPIYYSHVASADLSANTSTVYWGYTNSIALILAAIGSLSLGAIANNYAARKKLLLFFAYLGSIITLLLFFVTKGDWLFASIVFIAGNLCYTLADMFQNALLPSVTTPRTIDRVSTLGYALGYLGGGILLALNIVMINVMSDKELAVRLSFLTVSLWWILFTIPLNIFVKEPIQEIPSKGNPFTEDFSLIYQTFRKIKDYRHLMLFLIAFWIYNDGIGSIIIMAAIYGAEIGIDQNTLISALLMTQFVGIPFAFAFGYLADGIGAKKSIFIGLFVYTCVSIGGYFMTQPIHFWILAFFVGTVQGGTQALSRSLFGSMLPKHKITEFFGFYSMSSKLGSFIGPLVFSIVSQTTDNSRYGILSLIIFFLLGALLLSFVDVDKGREEADQAPIS